MNAFTNKRRKEWIREQGQSLAEMGIMIPFLLVLLLGVIELAQAFTVYIGMINAAREGAVYASLHPELRNEADLTNCSIAQEICNNYVDRIKGEALALKLDVDDNLTVTPPTIRPNDFGINCPITSTVAYSLTTFTSGMSLPLVGRFGLPNSYLIRYGVSMPIREADSYDPAACP
ncbi:MAG: hypothetical protein HDKAJFGB_03709 [Anaerolineae bacterium]|nr:hypothetical protein [Anaerolineae bacterium]RIK16564.1 MAG: hypothetical protein DCC52_17585 [Chloroflexota bacterium]